MGAAAQAFGLMVIGSCFYLFLLNVIGIVISFSRRSNRIPLHLGIASLILAALACLASLNMGGCTIVVFFIPSTVAAALNYGVWRYRYRPVLDSSTGVQVESKPARTFAMVSAILIAMLILSCFGMRPLVSAMGYLANGRGPAQMDRNDIPIGATKEELRSCFGEPHSVYFRGTNDERWHYCTSYLAGDGIGVEFDADGKVAKVWDYD
jgi:outer membrane protein assembly factor BamE (lipoprotein component of BamABCDE complex)